MYSLLMNFLTNPKEHPRCVEYDAPPKHTIVAKRMTTCEISSKKNLQEGGKSGSVGLFKRYITCRDTTISNNFMTTKSKNEGVSVVYTFS